MMERLSAEKRVLFLVSFFVCLVLVVYGNYHYQYRNIVYTDDDYDMFNDAARFMINEEIMASLNTVSSANTNFSLDLFKQLSNKDKTANVFYSPFSISSALAMVMLGARGTTASQMTEVLCFSKAGKQQQQRQQQQQQPQQQQQAKGAQQMMQMQQKGQASLPAQVKSLKLRDSQDQVHASFAELLGQLNKPKASYALSVANRLFGEQTYQFVEEFLGNSRKHYKAELEKVNFMQGSEAARLNINTWVEKQTQGKIKDILAEGSLNNLTRLVLVNAIYFKGNWNKKFDAQETRDADFRLNKNAKKTVKMMYRTSKFPLTYIPEINCQILEMPYKDKELSMLVFLPTDIEDSTTGLEKLEKALTYENFMEWTRPDMMNEVEVRVGFPRFKMEQKYDMKKVLVSMGMADAFDMSKCDFSGMSPANDLVLSEVFHKAFVEVNEEGTEAAAATAAVMMLRCALMPAAFIADHPFLFFIRHNSSMSILFAGRYCSPQ
ncbi:leukocyte elastase inhibitor-like isoform X4 [Oryzias latipes]|uniref:leukocyte elastase inhibitor-like isoform X4 n=1 Tax=Oryzias latipes TaxID=8090 RepID=UPI000CE1C34A|nr:leukocyte elastase inhibitor-like isoform X4 [Oryzias latipes]